MTKLTDSVQKPYRYYGGEFNTPDMNKPCSVRFCMCVADSYEVGMSNLGVRILYYMFNEITDVVCERCFAPFADYEQYLKEQKMPLCSLETSKPLAEFDFVGFSMQFEMCYSNVFYMLELAQIPVLASERGENSPFIRNMICEYLGYLGIALDQKANGKRGENILISTPDSRTKVLVIPTNEELAIARETYALVK